ncbi:hypothetical protein AeRB84_001431 [Aphanomyces euteiches]|nr:hypothetical protein AeRB84_001431 [Aphanomyces euteiches]
MMRHKDVSRCPFGALSLYIFFRWHIGGEPWPDCVRVLAGFGPENNRYYIPRDTVDPPNELQVQVFPQLESSVASLKSSRSTGTEIAGLSFMKLLGYMRNIVLQDAALLMEHEKYKTHPIFKHPLFSSNEFNADRHRVVELVQFSPSPESVVLREVLPLVAESLEGVRCDTAQIHVQLHDVNVQLAEVKTTLAKVDADSLRSADVANRHVSNALFRASMAIMTPTSAHNGSNMTTNEGCDVEPIVPIDTQQCNSGSAHDEVSKFRMSRQLYTVNQAWTEYVIGLPPSPSILSMERRCGYKWRSTNTDTQFFIRRKPLYEAIETLLREGKTEKQAVQIVESLLPKNKKLRSFCDLLKMKKASFGVPSNCTFEFHIKN